MTHSTDYRDTAAHRGKIQPPVLFESHEDGDAERELPWQWGVCPTCDGRGSYVNPSLDAHGIGAEEFAEDPDFREAYFQGVYDIPCATCNGRTTVPTLDESRCTPAEIAAYNAQQRELAGYAQEAAEPEDGGA